MIGSLFAQALGYSFSGLVQTRMAALGIVCVAGHEVRQALLQ